MARRVSSGNTGRRMGTPAFIGVLVGLGIIIVGGAIFLGKSDGGEINVSAAIQSSNQAAREQYGESAEQIGTVSQAFRNMPNGGLVPQSEEATPPVEETPEPSEEDVATTTDASPDATDATTDEAPVTSEEETPTEEGT